MISDIFESLVVRVAKSVRISEIVRITKIILNQ